MALRLASSLLLLAASARAGGGPAGARDLSGGAVAHLDSAADLKAAVAQATAGGGALFVRFMMNG